MSHRDFRDLVQATFDEKEDRLNDDLDEESLDWEDQNKILHPEEYPF